MCGRAARAGRARIEPIDGRTEDVQGLGDGPDRRVVVRLTRDPVLIQAGTEVGDQRERRVAEA